ncbi:MAG: hypothetical protein HY820_27755 [Acidobacteria bacterium]|nr:hypothetical protein [Acidobacteriota bacterium]
MNRIGRTLLVSLAWVTLFGANTNREPDGLVVHEWGTFTSIADAEGSPALWAPLIGRADLPCFVHRLLPGYSPKFSSNGLVRMETPVLYFYSTRAANLSVRVGFPQGLVTEWYPRASKVNPIQVSAEGFRGGHIDWNVQVDPAAKVTLPESRTPSHYFAARQTAAAPVRVGDETEKLLFYRGVGSFDVKVRPSFTTEGTLRVRNESGHPLPLAMLFESHSGITTLSIARGLGKDTTLAAPRTVAIGEVHASLVAALTAEGLYEDEARAMVETWKDSWFEDGSRLIYLVPRPLVDAVLPLQISPAPRQVARVFVGRIELASEGTRKTIEAAVLANDEKTLRQFGRFLKPLIQQSEPLSRNQLWTPFVGNLAARMEQERSQGPFCVQ